MDMTTLVHLEGADLLLYYNNKRELEYQLAVDPRAKVVNEQSVVKPSWKNNPAEVDLAWEGKNQGLFSLSAIHFWRNNIDFDYIDVGASLGMTAIPQAIFFARCGKNNVTYAFEPSPKTYSLLQKNIGVNEVWDRVTCVNAAAGDRSGTADFFVTPDQASSSSLSETAISREGIDNSNKISVKVLKIDDFAVCLRSAPGLLIKIDAEGFDFQVLDGMKKTLEERITVFLIEIFPSIIKDKNFKADISNLMEKYTLIDVGAERRIVDNRNIDGILKEISLRSPFPVSDFLAIDNRVPNSRTLISRILED